MAIGRRMPPWISDGFSEYAQRLRSGVRLELVEVDTPRRGQNPDLYRIVREEGARLLQAPAPTGLPWINPAALTIPSRSQSSWSSG